MALTDKHEILNLESNEVVVMTTAEMIEEVNRDRSDSWVDFNEDDFMNGWNHFVEGHILKYIRKMERKKVDLTSYHDNKGLLQLFKGNNEINRMLPTCTRDEFKAHLNENYVLTESQLDYILLKLIDEKK